MAGMYDMIMDLPLFRGLSHVEISSFLEKTHIEFLNFEKGDRIRDFGNVDDALLFVISGNVKTIWRNDKETMYLSYISGRSYVFGVFNLFGLVRENPFALEAIDKASLMRVSKKQYLDLLSLNPVYLLNYLNILSLQCQRGVEALASIDRASVAAIVRTMLLGITPTICDNIELNCDRRALCYAINMEAEAVEAQLNDLESRGLIEVTGDVIRIPSRRAFLDAQ
jgi:CRP-like cAMP-binding protein